MFRTTIRGRSQQRDAALVDRVGRELGLDHLEVGQRVTARLERRAVEHVHQGRAALDVAQELQPEALALAGAGDQPRDVGDGEAHLARLDDAEVGHQRGERVVGDLRPRGGQRRDQAGLAGARVADQGHVGDRLQLQDDVAAPPGSPSSAKPGALRRGRGQRGVAEPALATGATTNRVPAPTQVDERPRRPASSTTVPSGTGSTRSAPAAPLRLSPWPGLPGRRAAVRGVVVVEQGGRLRVDDEHDVAAVAAVAAVRTAERLELLPVHRRAAVAAVTAGDVQDDAVDERRHDDPSESVLCRADDAARGGPVTGPPSHVTA